MNLELQDKVALVTGSSRGIGRAIAAALLAEGAQVMLCARGADKLAQTRDELGGPRPDPTDNGPEHADDGRDQADDVRVDACVADITQPADRQRLVAQTLQRWGRLDILVHNAGGGPGGRALESPLADWQASMDVNTWSGLELARLAAPALRDAGGGAMLFIASIWGREAGGRPTYNAAKAAEISLAKSLSVELAAWNIRVNSLAPGSILFPGGGWERRLQADPAGIQDWVAREFPFGRFGRPDEVAAAAAFLCSPRASWITGVCLPVDGGQSRTQI